MPETHAYHAYHVELSWDPRPVVATGRCDRCGGATWHHQAHDICGRCGHSTQHQAPEVRLLKKSA